MPGPDDTINIAVLKTELGHIMSGLADVKQELTAQRKDTDLKFNALDHRIEERFDNLQKYGCNIGSSNRAQIQNIKEEVGDLRGGGGSKTKTGVITAAVTSTATACGIILYHVISAFMTTGSQP